MGEHNEGRARGDDAIILRRGVRAWHMRSLGGSEGVVLKMTGVRYKGFCAKEGQPAQKP